MLLERIPVKSKPPLLTVAQAAERLNTSARTVRNYINSGRLPAIQIATREWRIEEDDLEEFIRLHKRNGKS